MGNSKKAYVSVGLLRFLLLFWIGFTLQISFKSSPKKRDRYMISYMYIYIYIELGIFLFFRGEGALYQQEVKVRQYGGRNAYCNSPGLRLKACQIIDLHPSSLIPHPSSLIRHPSSHQLIIPSPHPSLHRPSLILIPHPHSSSMYVYMYVFV